MARTHRLSRRLFLSELGRGTVAVAVLGTAVISCGESVTEQVVPTDPAGGDDAAVDGDAAGAAADETGTGLRWERVSLGFVSAYVLARGSEVAIVDTGVAGSGPQIAAALSQLSLGWDDVDHVIVTHAHGDHVGGLDEVLTAAAGATGYAGVGDIEQLSAPRELMAVTSGDEVFGLQVLATPGHTPGHIVVLDPETGLLVAGDAVVSDDAGVLAGPSEEFSADIAVARASLKALPVERVETILVGHGAPVTADGGGQLAELAATL